MRRMQEAEIKDVLDAVRATRELSFPGYGKAEVEKRKSEDATEVVTRLDYEIEERLAKELSALDGSVSFVGEEYGGDRGAQRFWLCDPIDGTGNYVRGIPVCSTMLARIENGKVAFSVIYDFVNDDMYHAVKGGGAFRNGEPLSVSGRAYTGAYIYYESNLDLPGNLERYHTIRKKTAILKTMSAGYELAMVASGKVEARICKDPYGKDYDFAPGTLLVAEAGGVVKNIGSDSYDYTNLNFIAATSAFYEEISATKLFG